MCSFNVGKEVLEATLLGVEQPPPPPPPIFEGGGGTDGQDSFLELSDMSYKF